MIKMKQFFEIYLLLIIITIIHEIGHVATMKMFGVKIRRIQICFLTFVKFTFWGRFVLALGFLPFGGYTFPQQNDWLPLASWKKKIILFAGIGMNLLTALICFMFDGIFLHDLMIISIAKAAINLFPFTGSDGYKMLMLNYKRKHGIK